jgi:hypothetical protein
MYSPNNNPFFDQVKAERARIPEVKMNESCIGWRAGIHLIGYNEFSRWAGINIPVHQYISQLCSSMGFNYAERLQYLCYHLTLENRKMFDLLLKAEENRQIVIHLEKQKPLTRWQKIKMLAKEIITQ